MHYQPIVRRLLSWFIDNARDLPWRATRDPYAIWVSEIMLQQTQVKTVIPYWERWMRQLPTIHSLAATDSGKLHKLWEGLGYYSRVRNLQKAARIIVAEHNGIFPHQFENILDLPGIGRYTAGAICSIAFNQPYPVLDGNVTRVLARVFGIAGNPRKPHTNAKLWQLAEDLVRNAVKVNSRPSAAVSLVSADAVSGRRKETFVASNLNQALIELGALICSARQPRCEVCPIAGSCVAHKEDRVEDLPTAIPRSPVTKRRFAAFLLQRNGRLVVRQRPKGTVNALLWEFPNVELSPEDHDVQKAAKRELGISLVLHPFCTIRHTITRFRITLDVFRASLGNGVLPSIRGGGQWLTKTAMERLPFNSAHKKIVLKLSADLSNLPD